ncbi:MAG: ABC transporter permease [Kineosporiaceae bacterium]
MIRLMRAMLRPSSPLIAVVVVLMLGTALGNLWLPSLNADIIDTGVLNGDTGYVISRGGIMLAVAVVIGAASVLAVYLSAKIAARFGKDVRARLFHHAAGFSLHEVGRFGAPSLITRNTNDVQQVQMLVVMGLSMMILAPITAVGGVVMALRENVRLSGLLLVIIPAMVVVVFSVLGRAVPLFRVVQDKIDAVNGTLRDSLTGVRVVRAFVRTREMERRFEVANADLTGTLLRVNRLFALMMPSLMLVFNASSVGIIWFGAGLVDRGELQIGQLTAFLSYIMQILFSVMMATMMAVMIPRAAASAERIEPSSTPCPPWATLPLPARFPPTRGRSQGAAGSTSASTP